VVCVRGECVLCVRGVSVCDVWCVCVVCGVWCVCVVCVCVRGVCVCVFGYVSVDAKSFLRFCLFFISHFVLSIPLSL